ncbi:hypothetical protein [Moorena producens]
MHVLIVNLYQDREQRITGTGNREQGTVVKNSKEFLLLSIALILRIYL